MAETLLDFEKDVITLRNQVPEPESRNEIEITNSDCDYDYEDWIWDRISDYMNAASRDMNYASASEVSDCSYDDLNEVMDYLAQDNGDPSIVSPCDLDNYLCNRGETLSDYDDMDRLLQYAADEMFRDDVWEDKESILRYYGFEYWENEYGRYIPRELASEIDSNDWGGSDYLSDASDFIEDWLTDHEGIMEFQP